MSNSNNEPQGSGNNHSHQARPPSSQFYNPNQSQQFVNQSYLLQQQQQYLIKQEEERRRFEKERQYQLQQKRLQEMSTGSVSSSSVSADHLIKNIMQKVDSDVKIMKNMPSSAASLAPQSSISSISASISYPSSIHSSSAAYQQQLALSSNLQYHQQHNPLPQPMLFQANQSQQQLNQTLNVSQMMTQTQASQHNQPNQRFPPWCIDMSKAPQLYLQVWQLVQITPGSGGHLCDTNRLYPILMSSGFQTDLLAKLWTSVNRTVPGQLTLQELFLILSLIAVLQQNPNCNPFQEVSSLTAAPIPRLAAFANQVQAPVTPIQTPVIPIQTPVIPNQAPVIPIQTPVIAQQQKHLNPTSLSLKEQKPPKQTVEVSKKSEVITDGSSSENDNHEFADFTELRRNLPDMKMSSNEEQSDTSKDKFDVFRQTISSDNQILDQKDQQLFKIESNDEDDFDDFKSADFEQVSRENKKEEENRKREINEHKQVPETNVKKPATLSDALLLNITALTPLSSSKPMQDDVEFEPFVVANWPEETSTTSDASKSTPMTTTISTVSSILSDKYQAFKEFQDESQTADGNEFGDFSSKPVENENEHIAGNDSSLQFGTQSDDSKSLESGVTNVSVGLEVRVLQCCKLLLHKAFNILVVNHGQDSVMDAMSTKEGKSFALDLREVYRVAKRIEDHINSSTSTNQLILELIGDIESTWTTLVKIFERQSIEINSNESQDNESSSLTSSCPSCSICHSSKVNTNGCTLISFGAFHYHSSCANLWLNCIDGTLPGPNTSSKTSMTTNSIL